MTLSAYANIGHGAKLYISSDSTNSTWAAIADTTTTNYTAVAEMRSMSVDADCGEAEVTSLSSSGTREYLPTYLGATVSGSLNWIPNDSDASPVVFNAYQGRKVASWWLEIPTRGNTAATAQNLFFLGFINSFRVNVEGDAAQTGDITWRVADSTIVD